MEKNSYSFSTKFHLKVFYAVKKILIISLSKCDYVLQNFCNTNVVHYHTSFVVVFSRQIEFFTPNWIVLRCIGSFYVILHHFTSYCIVLRQIKSYKDVLHRFTLYCIVFRRIASFIVELNLIKAALDIFGIAFCGFDFSWILKMQITLEIGYF